MFKHYLNNSHTQLEEQFCLQSHFHCLHGIRHMDNGRLFSWRIPLVLLITALVMTLSTVWNIRKIMHTNPTDILGGVN